MDNNTIHNQAESANANDTNDATITKGPPKEVSKEATIGLLEKDTEVSINKTTLIGKISGYHVSADQKVLSYLVEYEEDGEKHEKAFLPNQVSPKIRTENL